MIDLKDVRIFRNKTPILKTISLQNQRGECVALMGLNGSGKSTLLKTLLGLHLDYEGQISLKGNLLKSPSSLNIAYLPEKFKACGTLTGQQFLDFFQDAYEDLENTLKFPKDSLSKQIKTYSKGMLQKLGLIHFFAQNNELKIADEIMSGLDFKTRHAVQTLIKKQISEGVTFLFTKHTHQDACAVASRLLYLESGNITFDGPPKNWSESLAA